MTPNKETVDNDRTGLYSAELFPFLNAPRNEMNMNQTIRFGKHSVTVHQFTGKVAGVSKNFETRVHGGGGGGGTYNGTGGSAPVTISSTTVIHDQLFLVNKEGRELALQLEGWNLACRDGNIVTAMWAIVDKDERGKYFVMMNHSTDNKDINDRVIDGIARRCVFGRQINLPGDLGCWVLIALGALVIGAFAIWWPLGVALIAFGVYNERRVKKNIIQFNSELQLPTVELW